MIYLIHFMFKGCMGPLQSLDLVKITLKIFLSGAQSPINFFIEGMYLNDKRIKSTLSGENSVVVDILTEAYKKKKGKIISRIYNSLQKWKRNNTGYDRAKWEKELNTEYHKRIGVQCAVHSIHPPVQRGGEYLV